MTPLDRNDDAAAPTTAAAAATQTPAWRRVSGRRWLLAGALALAVWTAGPRVLRFATRGYESTLKLRIDGSGAPVIAFDAGVSSSGNGDALRVDLATLQTMCGIIESERILVPVAEKLQLQQRWAGSDGRQLSTDQVLRRLRVAVSARAARDSQLINVAVVAPTPNDAAEIANAIADAFREDRQQIRQEQMNAGITGLRTAVEEQAGRMRDAQERFAKLRHAADADSKTTADSQHTAAEETLRQISADVVRARLDLTEKTARIEALKELAAQHRYDAVGALAAGDGALNAALQRLSDLNGYLAFLEERYGLGYPALRASLGERDLLTRQIDERLATLIAGASIEADFVRQRADRLQERLDASRTVAVRSVEDSHAFALAEAQRTEERETRLYETLSERLQKMIIQSRIPGSSIDVLDRARAPVGPLGSGPFEAQTVALISGVLAAGLLLLILESLDTSLKSAEEVERCLRLPVIGVLPRGMRALATMGDDEPRASHVEACRVLRNNMDFSRLDGAGVRSLCVVSAGPGEGKSLTAANLACTYAQAGSRVLIVDTDLRHSTAHTIFGMSNDADGAGGVVQVLDGTRSLAEAVRATPVSNVWLLSSGASNRTRTGIDPHRISALVAKAGAAYDVVIYDTPSVLAVSDAVVVAREVGLAVMVVREGRYARNAVRRARNALNNAGVHVVGVAFNGVSHRAELACTGYREDAISFRLIRAQTQQSRVAPPRGKLAA